MIVHQVLWFLALVLLIVCLWIEREDKAKAYAIFVMTVTTVISRFIYEFDAIDEFTADGAAYYISKSLESLVLIACLTIKPIRESALVMLFSSLTIMVNIIGFSMYASGVNGDMFVNVLSMIALYASILVMMSKGICDGIYRYITGFSMVNYLCYHIMGIDNTGVQES
ncbi:MAG: hypothetical protein JKY50_00880 [Oleispira sp.]|nr:hypothetical protein [Oleispira sp.]